MSNKITYQKENPTPEQVALISKAINFTPPKKARDAIESVTPTIAAEQGRMSVLIASGPERLASQLACYEASLKTVAPMARPDYNEVHSQIDREMEASKLSVIKMGAQVAPQVAA
jgi:hypothetical protein